MSDQQDDLDILSDELKELDLTDSNIRNLLNVLIKFLIYKIKSKQLWMDGLEG